LEAHVRGLFKLHPVGTWIAAGAGSAVACIAYPFVMAAILTALLGCWFSAKVAKLLFRKWLPVGRRRRRIVRPIEVAEIETGLLAAVCTIGSIGGLMWKFERAHPWWVRGVILGCIAFDIALLFLMPKIREFSESRSNHGHKFFSAWIMPVLIIYESLSLVGACVIVHGLSLIVRIFPYRAQGVFNTLFVDIFRLRIARTVGTFGDELAVRSWIEDRAIELSSRGRIRTGAWLSDYGERATGLFAPE
jgi:hypothetical protein